MTKKSKKHLVIDDKNYFGHCDVPEHDNYYLNIGRGHWMVCDSCKISWFIGANLFSSWREQNRDVWEANAERIKNYNEIDINAPCHIKSMEDDKMRELPTTKYKGKWYFIDFRLKQFRSVTAPIEFVPFESDLGRKIDGMPEPEEDFVSME